MIWLFFFCLQKNVDFLTGHIWLNLFLRHPKNIVTKFEKIFTCNFFRFVKRGSKIANMANLRQLKRDTFRIINAKKKEL